MERLTSSDGSLFLKHDILVYRYPAGDCDTLEWPNPNKQHLASVLFDAFESGELNCRTVLLPDGHEFNIDDNL